MTLDRAIAALQRDDYAAAYRELVGAWRDHRSDQLAQAASEVHALVPARPAIEGREWLETWRATHAARDPVDVPRLVVAAERAGLGDVIALVPELAVFADDPRLAHELCRVLADLRWYSPNAIAAYRAVAALVPAAGARELAFLRKPLAEARRRESPFRTELIALLEALVAAASDRPAVADLDLSDLRIEIAEALARRAVRAARTTALYAAVYAAPADDGPRLALADDLLEIGDPRGELIALQCQRDPLTRAQSKRVRKLLETYSRQWTHEHPVFRGAREITFERGFPATVSIALEDGKTRGAPAWSTIRQLTLASRDKAAHEMFDPVCASLAAVYQINRATMQLATTATHPTTIRRLGFSHDDHGVEHLADALAVFPALREVVIHEPTEPARLAEVALAKLEVYGRITADHLALLGPRLAEVISSPLDDRYTLRFSRHAPTAGYLHLKAHGWETLRHLELRVQPHILVIDRLDPGDCEDCLAAVCSDAELAGELGCPVEWS